MNGEAAVDVRYRIGGGAVADHNPLRFAGGAGRINHISRQVGIEAGDTDGRQNHFLRLNLSQTQPINLNDV
ncbi:hypothetical protein D3C75_959250 [compost metagenome]